MRKGELLTLRFGGYIDWERRAGHVRPENAKGKKGRIVPVGTTRLRTLLEFLRIDSDQ